MTQSRLGWEGGLVRRRRPREDRPSGGTSGGRVSRGGGGTLPQGRRRLEITVGEEGYTRGESYTSKRPKMGR